MVIGRCHLDHVGGDDVEAVEHPQHEQQFTARQTTDFRSAGARSKGRIQHVDVDGQVDGEVSDPVLHLLRGGFRTDDDAGA